MSYNFNEVRAIQKAQIIPPDIIRIEADINYSIVHLTSGKKIILAKTLKQFQEMLDPQNFVRPCRSHLINTRFIKKASETKVILKNGFQLPVSRRRRIGLMTIINITNN
ncbi:LytTR family DNA-binding domain-containing protein [uncultured Arcticibacterium sp.]|uniref:LytR/AlgR family response regulator transcription factor n=1 Tax=uncultured Arcticibacterium sp. TaxID=2173042 RepID=UPI0030F63B9C